MLAISSLSSSNESVLWSPYSDIRVLEVPCTVAWPALSVRRGKVKERTFPIFSLFFPDFSSYFSDFWQILRCQGGHSASLTPNGYAIALATWSCSFTTQSKCIIQNPFLRGGGTQTEIEVELLIKTWKILFWSITFKLLTKWFLKEPLGFLKF